MEPPLAPVARAGRLRDKAPIDELLQDAGETLLRDAQDVEQIRHPEARPPVDKVQHAVMGPAETEFFQHIVGLAGEIPVGEEQKLDEPDHGVVGRRAARRRFTQ